VPDGNRRGAQKVVRRSELATWVRERQPRAECSRLREKLFLAKLPLADAILASMRSGYASITRLVDLPSQRPTVILGGIHFSKVLRGGFVV
jgi:hypothetical protein